MAGLLAQSGGDYLVSHQRDCAFLLVSLYISCRAWQLKEQTIAQYLVKGLATALDIVGGQKGYLRALQMCFVMLGHVQPGETSPS